MVLPPGEQHGLGGGKGKGKGQNIALKERTPHRATELALTAF